MNQYEDMQALSEEEGPQFNNLVVDKNTGRVYIGAVNKLYQLSPNLEPMVNINIDFTQQKSTLVCGALCTQTRILHFVGVLLCGTKY